MYTRTNLMLRLPLELHTAITERATTAGMSMNQWVTFTLAAAILRESETITLTTTTTQTYRT